MIFTILNTSALKVAVFSPCLKFKQFVHFQFEKVDLISVANFFISASGTSFTFFSASSYSLYVKYSTSLNRGIFPQYDSVQRCYTHEHKV